MVIPPLKLLCSSVLSVALVSCAQNAPPPNYFGTASGIKLRDPVYVVVQDLRPTDERTPKDASDRYIQTVDPINSAPVALIFADDLRNLLLRKSVARKALVVETLSAVPEGATVVDVTLNHWYGRVANFDNLTAPEKAFLAANLSSAVAYDNRGECSFAVTLRESLAETNLGEFTGTSQDKILNGGPREANALSGLAADKAFFQFMQALEKLHR